MKRYGESVCGVYKWELLFIVLRSPTTYRITGSSNYGLLRSGCYWVEVVGKPCWNCVEAVRTILKLYRTTVRTTRGTTHGTTRVANEVTCAFGISIFSGRNPITPISRRFLVGRLVSKLLVRFRRPNYRPWCYILYRESRIHHRRIHHRANPARETINDDLWNPGNFDRLVISHRLLVSIVSGLSEHDGFVSRGGHVRHFDSVDGLIVSPSVFSALGTFVIASLASSASLAY